MLTNCHFAVILKIRARETGTTVARGLNKTERGERVEDRDKKKAAEVLKEIDSSLDTVLSILGKLALVAASVKTIIDIVTKL